MRLHFRPVVPPATLSAIALAAVTLAGQSAPAAAPLKHRRRRQPRPAAPAAADAGAAGARARIQEESRADHAQMMQQLGIKAVRPGRNSNESQPNAANYDEAQANPYPNSPS